MPATNFTPPPPPLPVADTKINGHFADRVILFDVTNGAYTESAVDVLGDVDLDDDSDDVESIPSFGMCPLVERINVILTLEEHVFFDRRICLAHGSTCSLSVLFPMTPIPPGTGLAPPVWSDTASVAGDRPLPVCLHVSMFS